MKANELRIGNLFTGFDDKYDKVDLTFFSLLFKGIEVDEIIKSPVILSEEILLKVGFVEDKLNGAFETFENGLKFTIIDKLGAWMIYLYGPFGMIVLKHIKFVNELQNLFNSLTGQELNTGGLI